MKLTQQKDYTWYTTLLIALVFGAVPLFYMSKLLDIGLVSRFLLLSMCLFVFFVFHKAKIMLSWIELAWLAYYVWNLATIVWAQNFADAIFQAQKVFMVFALFICIRYMINAENTIYKTICITNVIILGLGMKQMILLPSFNIYDIYDIIGLQCHKNLYASLLFLCSPFLILGYLNHQDTVWKISFLGVLFLNVVWMMFLQTRAVYVGLGVFALTGGLLYLMALKQYISIKVVGIICAFLFCAVGATKLLYESKSHEIAAKDQQEISPRIQSVQERLGIWKNTQKLIQENSITGVGLGSWPVLYPKFGLEGLTRAQTENVNFQNPHNDLLWVWSEVGTIGLLLLLVVYAGVVAAGIKTLFSKTPTFQTKVAILVLTAAFIGFQAISFFDFPKDRIEHLVMATALMVFIGHKANMYRMLLNLPVWSKLFMIALLGLNIKISWGRIRGETHSVTVYMARAQGDWNTLIQACDQAKSTFYTLDPTGIPLDWYRGVAHFSLGNIGVSLQDFQEAYRLNRYNFHILNNLASAHETLGQHDLAKKYYQEAIRINPAFDEAKLNLFVIFFNEGDYDSASNSIKSCTQASDRRTQYLQLLHTKSSQK